MSGCGHAQGGRSGGGYGRARRERVPAQLSYLSISRFCKGRGGEGAGVCFALSLLTLFFFRGARAAGSSSFSPLIRKRAHTHMSDGTSDQLLPAAAGRPWRAREASNNGGDPMVTADGEWRGGREGSGVGASVGRRPGDGTGLPGLAPGCPNLWERVGDGRVGEGRERHRPPVLAGDPRPPPSATQEPRGGVVFLQGTAAARGEGAAAAMRRQCLGASGLCQDGAGGRRRRRAAAPSGGGAGCRAQPPWREGRRDRPPHPPPTHPRPPARPSTTSPSSARSAGLVQRPPPAPVSS